MSFCYTNLFLYLWWCSIGFRRIDIVLDHPQKVYYSGHQISGNVHLELDEPTNALGR